MENQFLQIKSLLSIYKSLPNLRILPPTGGWAGSPDFLAKIIEVILSKKPRFVLEAGSGVSTIIIGLALQLNKKGHSISLDHDLYYSEKTIELLKLNLVEDNSKVIHVSFIDYTIHNEKWKWYKIDNLVTTEEIDMLIVDGPPGNTQFLARYPAIPLLHEHFAENTTVLLDDSNRDDEVIIIEKWIEFLESRMFKVKVTKYCNFDKGLVIMELDRVQRRI